jgi:hypothetical protein
MRKIFFIALLLSGSADAQYTSEEICSKLSKTKQDVQVFFDAYDVDQGKTHNSFHVFKIGNAKKMGEFFDDVKQSSGYVTSQNNIPYEYQRFDQRLFTRFFNIPKVVTKDQKYWNVYKLCKSASCSNPDKSTVQKGDWHLTLGMDDQIIANQDVYYLIYPGKKPAKVNCVD